MASHEERRRRHRTGVVFRWGFVAPSVMSGQIKPKEDAGARARQDRGIGDKWLAVGPSNYRAAVRFRSALAGTQAEQRIDRNLTPDTAPDHGFVNDRRQSGRQA